MANPTYLTVDDIMKVRRNEEKKSGVEKDHVLNSIIIELDHYEVTRIHRGDLKTNEDIAVVGETINDCREIVKSYLGLAGGA